jgi:hypothetical protein
MAAPAGKNVEWASVLKAASSHEFCLLLSRERAQASIQYSVYNPDDPEAKRGPRRGAGAIKLKLNFEI